MADMAHKQARTGMALGLFINGAVTPMLAARE